MKLGAWLRRVALLKYEIRVLCMAARDPRVPWYAKALGLVVVAYVVSPIDLIPDFIPILGWLDDLAIVPLGFMAVRALIPKQVLAECRERARR